jgi:AbrB family looped-hinge helix DNA binding protein
MPYPITKSLRMLCKNTSGLRVVIPKEICDELGLHEGDFVEVTSTEGQVIIKPKRLVDADDMLMPAEEQLVRKGEAQLKKGQHVLWDDVQKQLDL